MITLDLYTICARAFQITKQTTTTIQKMQRKKKKWKRQSDHNRNHVFDVDEIILRFP